MNLHNHKALKENRRLLRYNSTYAEKILWQKIRKKQVKNIRFHRQFSIGGYILDFYGPQYRIAIEIDGEYHNNKEQTKLDQRRTEFLKRHNIKILRFTNEEVIKNPQKIIQNITSTLSSSPSCFKRGLGGVL